MTDPPDTKDAGENEAVRALVKRALAKGTLASNPPDILRGVQRRIRARSRGKFFGDGWSTGHARQAYLLLAVITLLMVGIAYFVLLPMDVH